MVNPGKDIKTANMSGEMDEYGNVEYTLAEGSFVDDIPDDAAFEGVGSTPAFPEEEDQFDDVPELGSLQLDITPVQDTKDTNQHDNSSNSLDDFETPKSKVQVRKPGNPQAKGRPRETFASWAQSQKDIKHFLQFNTRPPRPPGKEMSRIKYKNLKCTAAKKYKLDGTRLMFLKKGNWVEIITDREECISVMKQLHGDNSKKLHSMNVHLGRNFLRQMVCSHYQWIRMTLDIDNFKASCEICARASSVYLKKGRFTQCLCLSFCLLHVSPSLILGTLCLSGNQVLHPVPIKPKVWYLVSLDLIGPLPESPEGYKYCLTIIDYFTKWPIMKPLLNKSAREVARALYEVYCDWGVCDFHITDQGREFCNMALDGELLCQMKSATVNCQHHQPSQSVQTT